jgi:hypothetical protein
LVDGPNVLQLGQLVLLVKHVVQLLYRLLLHLLSLLLEFLR